MFKEEGMFEPLQYHLTQFVHEGESLHRQIALELEQFEGTLSIKIAQKSSPQKAWKL